MKKALITGIAGQDGSYLSEYLLSVGYEVHGIIRRNSTPEHQESRIAHLENKVRTYYGDVTDQSSIERIMREVMPDEIYNLAAQSHVRISSDMPQFTFQTNAVGVLNMLEAYRTICPGARFYQASSSEMFGDSVDADGYQRETTPMTPVSPYGCSKLAAYSLVRHYRAAYNLHACNGILFNHESPRRGANFVTTKIVKAAVNIHRGHQKTLSLGNLDSFRDWGFAGDYVRAMHLLLNHDALPSEYVIATGETHSVREFCDIVFSSLSMDYQKFVTVDEKFFRPQELKYLKGDRSKATRELKWLPSVSFHNLVTMMVSEYKKLLS